MSLDLWDLTIQALKRKKQSSFLLQSVLLLSVAFAVIMLCVTGSIGKTNKEYRFDTYGTWYGAIPYGLPQDETFLRQQPWLEQLGVSWRYGVITAGSATGGIGTTDDAFLRIGRIALQKGRFPAADGEIAMESDLLSALGYDYTLQQEITLTIQIPAGSSFVMVERSFTLTGILREYTSLWVLSNQVEKPLNSALITPSDAALLCAAAEEEAGAQRERALDDGETQEELSPDPPVLSYFFTVPENERDLMKERVNGYLSSAHADLEENPMVCINTVAYQDQQAQNYNEFYLFLILLVTLLAVVCIYSIQLQEQVRHIVLFRSIGITRRQLRVMMFYETICLCLPAVLLGTAAGAAGTWLLLRLAVYSGSSPIRVEIPFGMLCLVLLIWLFSVIAVRLAVFQIALRVPLTGRFHMESRKSRRYRRLQKILILLLGSTLGLVFFFTLLEVLTPAHFRAYWSELPSYVIYSTVPDTEKGEIITREQAEVFSRVPGVSDVKGFGEVRVELKFDGMEHQPYAIAARESMAIYEDSMTVFLYAIDDKKWRGDPFDLAATDVDLEAFRRGDCVVMVFPTYRKKLCYDWKTYEQSGISVGDQIVLQARKSKDLILGETTVPVGGFLYLEEGVNNQMLSVDSPYNVICSEAFLEKLLSSCKPGILWEKYRTGGIYGYSRIFAYTDLNAGFLSTDTVIAEQCVERGLMLTNRREDFASRAQGYLQTILLLLTSGISILLILLLILRNALCLESKRERRRYGILQAIGMSQGQMRVTFLRQALGRGIFAALLGWMLYGGYLVSDAVRTQQRELADAQKVHSLMTLFRGELSVLQRDGATLWMAAWMTMFVIFLIVFLSLHTRRELFRGDLMSKLREEQ